MPDNGQNASWKGSCDDSGLRDDNLALPWMFDVSLHDSGCCVAAQCPSCSNVRHFSQYYRSERLAHDRIAARALATLVMKKEAGYRRLRRHALIIKQDQYNSTALEHGVCLPGRLRERQGTVKTFIRIPKTPVKCRVVLSRLIATAPKWSTLDMACSSRPRIRCWQCRFFKARASMILIWNAAVSSDSRVFAGAHLLSKRFGRHIRVRAYVLSDWST